MVHHLLGIVFLPPAFIGTGELTVTVSGNGKGGRNQEMLLSFIISLSEMKKGELITVWWCLTS